MKQYLPSRKFVIGLIIILAFIGIVFGAYKLIIYFKNKQSSKGPQKVLVKELVQKDSNKNGIPDWEEYLWGLDPQKNGEENKTFILDKKKSLIIENPSLLEDEAELTENELLSREVFAVIMAMQESGNITDESIQYIADQIGGKIVSEPLPDIYTRGMLTTTIDTEDTVMDYYDKINEIILKYGDEHIGEELVFISQGLSRNDENALQLTKRVALAYKNFGADLMKITVPESLAGLNISLANNYNKTSESIYDLTEMLSDTLTGMKGLLNYNKYSDTLMNDLDKLEIILTKIN